VTARAEVASDSVVIFCGMRARAGLGRFCDACGGEVRVIECDSDAIELTTAPVQQLVELSQNASEREKESALVGGKEESEPALVRVAAPHHPSGGAQRGGDRCRILVGVRKGTHPPRVPASARRLDRNSGALELATGAKHVPVPEVSTAELGGGFGEEVAEFEHEVALGRTIA